MSGESKQLLRITSSWMKIGDQTIFQDLDLEIERGEIVGLVGPSGSGKSVFSKFLMGLTDGFTHADDTTVLFNPSGGATLRLDQLNEKQWESVRGKQMSMIFQEPKMALNPSFSCGFQLDEVIRQQGLTSLDEVKKRTLEVLSGMGLPSRIYEAYPFQISGGEAQRIMIAMATLTAPPLLLADEPTTSLDPHTEWNVVNVLQELNANGMSILMISHDLDLLRTLSHRIFEIRDYGLKEVQTGGMTPFFGKAPGQNAGTTEILRVHDLSLENVGDRKSSVPILHAVDFSVRQGEVLGIVGLSGSGKSTLSRCVLQLLPQYTGQVSYRGQDLATLDNRQLRAIRKELQIIFQDPLDSLNPRQQIFSALEEVIKVHGPGESRQGRHEMIDQMMERVNLSGDLLTRYPHQLSGGERQRVCIARVLLLEPAMIILDEPVSSLDSEVKKDLLELLLKLKDEFNLTYIFISHDMRLVNFMCNRVLVMNQGFIVEEGPTEAVMNHPTTDYTKMLIQTYNRPSNG